MQYIHSDKMLFRKLDLNSRLLIKYQMLLWYTNAENNVSQICNCVLNMACDILVIILRQSLKGWSKFIDINGSILPEQSYWIKPVVWFNGLSSGHNQTF